MVTNAWVLFRAPSFASASTVLSTMYGVSGPGIAGPLTAYWSAEWSRIIDFRWSESGVVWLLIVGSVAFILPNSYQLFESFRPALIERPFDEASKPRLRWTPDWKWAVCLSLMLLIAILRIGELSPFIYFQF
jgi:hypothetical protein